MSVEGGTLENAHKAQCRRIDTNVEVDIISFVILCIYSVSTH
jgi:hypothetical protein